MDIIQQLTDWSGQLSGLLWGNPVTLLVLLGTGCYLTMRMGLIQVRGFRTAVDLIAGKVQQPPRIVGEVSHFQALSTALSATVGTGNIAGRRHGHHAGRARAPCSGCGSPPSSAWPPSLPSAPWH